MLELSFIISFVVLFLHAITQEGMILSFIPELFWNAPVWIKKPLYACPICMTPWWGSVIILGFGVISDEWPHWYIWLLQIMVAGGMNVVFSSFINEKNDTPEKLEL